ncbi:MAG: hypothetical protein M1823_001835 [Watsoniomyces obsoletus]|nr:MAG: hypothetical protein M1823_001835 [Watsoniomyces obsoletus]
MNIILQEQFQRVENALLTLVDSIASYTPSTQAVETLLEADDELTRGLDRLSTHQANHVKITQLRQTSTALSDQITTALTLLSTTRAELLATPATVFPENDGIREVASDELLAYAKRISKFTVPPTFRVSVPPATTSPPSNVASPGQPTQVGGEANRVTSMTNGTGATTTADEVQGEQKTTQKGVAIAALPQQESEWLDPAATFTFTPWPTEDVIVRGGLGRIQAMLDAGEDPALVVNSTDTVVPEDGHVKMKDEEKQMKLDEERFMQSAAAATQLERELPTRDKHDEGVSMGDSEPMRPRHEEPPPPPKPAVFGGLDLYDPDEEQ